jgi:hypothetical protein
MSNEETKKAEYPLNKLGLGFRSTMESGPYFKDDVDYAGPLENDEGQFCGACAFWRAGTCIALEEDVHILGHCYLYISMDAELSLRHHALMLRMEAEKEKTEKSEELAEYEPVIATIEELEILEISRKYIAKRDGKYCVISHQTGKNFGCYGSKSEAKKRLGQIKAFKDDEVPVEDVEMLEKGTLIGDSETKEVEVKFASMDEERRLVYGIVLEPDEVDAHGDTVTTDHIEKAAHGYMMRPMVVGDGHMTKAKAQPVESFIYTKELLNEVKEGSWVMAVKVHSDRIWEGIKNGDYTGFSIGAYVRRRPLEVEDNESN